MKRKGNFLVILAVFTLLFSPMSFCSEDSGGYWNYFSSLASSASQRARNAISGSVGAVTGTLSGWASSLVSRLSIEKQKALFAALADSLGFNVSSMVKEDANKIDLPPVTILPREEITLKIEAIDKQLAEVKKNAPQRLVYSVGGLSKLYKEVDQLEKEKLFLGLQLKYWNLKDEIAELKSRIDSGINLSGNEDQLIKSLEKDVDSCYQDLQLRSLVIDLFKKRSVPKPEISRVAKIARIRREREMRRMKREREVKAAESVNAMAAEEAQ